jgi:hypothetical protein
VLVFAHVFACLCGTMVEEDCALFPGYVWPTGTLGVRVRNEAELRSRDKSSDLIPNNTVLTTGSWGDIPGVVSTNYESPTSFWVNWGPARSNYGYDVQGMRVRVRSIPAVHPSAH